MNPSDLNRRVTFQRKVRGKGPGGIPTEAWSDVVTVWAAKDPLRTREFFAAAAVNAEDTVKFRVRYRTDIKPDMRIVDDGRVYSITGVQEDPLGDRTETRIMAREVVAGG